MNNEAMISVFGSFVGDEEITNVTTCMKSQWMGFGRQVDDFEQKYQRKFHLPTFAMVDSGSNALFMAVTLLDLPPRSEIIVPSFTWVSCAQAVILAGHIPVFCDVDLHTMNVRANDIQTHITDKTAAVMVVHYAGLAVDMDPILALGYPVIEDAAHAVDSTYHGQPCGSIGDVGIFSYDAVKNLTVGEGGGSPPVTRSVLNGLKSCAIVALVSQDLMQQLIPLVAKPVGGSITLRSHSLKCCLLTLQLILDSLSLNVLMPSNCVGKKFGRFINGNLTIYLD